MKQASQTIESWFRSGEQFEEALEAAEANAEAQDDERAAEFLESLRSKWDEHGVRTFLSGSQHKWLMQLADL